MIDPRSHAVDPAWVDTRNAAVSADPAARVAGNAVATTDVEKLTVDRRVIASIDTSVSDLIPDAIVTDQKRSGRCWAFAGLNVLRASLI
jgi:aminopeptidase C, bleomycin hydrolase